MPVYEYGASGESEGCKVCNPGFSIHQGMNEESLKKCPECGSDIKRLLFVPNISAPTSDTEYRDMGFTKLVKRDDGVYENVTQRGGESKYMERGKADTMPDISKIIRD
jgi:putative FmdB family regulatory protein